MKLLEKFRKILNYDDIWNINSLFTATILMLSRNLSKLTNKNLSPVVSKDRKLRSTHSIRKVWVEHEVAYLVELEMSWVI